MASGLPIVATTGEWVADQAASRGAGFTVPARKPKALAGLLVELADDPARLTSARARAPHVAAGFSYETTVAPVAGWCGNPRRARAGSPSLSAPGTGIVGRLRGRLRRTLHPSTGASQA
jgi:hypothetical protein